MTTSERGAVSSDPCDGGRHRPPMTPSDPGALSSEPGDGEGVPGDRSGITECLTLGPDTAARLAGRGGSSDVLLMLVTADWCAPAGPARTLLRELMSRSAGDVLGAVVDVSEEQPHIELTASRKGSAGLVVVEDAGIATFSSQRADGRQALEPSGSTPELESRPIPASSTGERAPGRLLVGGSSARASAAEGAVADSHRVLDAWGIEVLPTWIRWVRRGVGSDGPLPRPLEGAEDLWVRTLTMTGAHAKHEVSRRMLQP